MTDTRQGQDTDNVQSASMSRLDEPTVDDDVANQQIGLTAVSGVCIEAKTVDDDEATSNSSEDLAIDGDIESNNKRIQTTRHGLFPMNERQLAYEPRLSRCACVTLLLGNGFFIGGIIFWFVFSKDMMNE